MKTKVVRESYKGKYSYAVYSHAWPLGWYKERDFILEEDAVDMAKRMLAAGPDLVVWHSKPSCCIRRARARYWRIARGYLGLGVALGVALGMVLGAASKVCQ